MADLAPWLGRAEARRGLRVPAEIPLVLGLGSGEAERQAALCRLLGKIAARAGAALRFVSDVLPGSPPVVRLFPAARWLPAADEVVTAAGYYAFHETTGRGVPTAYVPQRRRHDDQARRARHARVAGTLPGLGDREVRGGEPGLVTAGSADDAVQAAAVSRAHARSAADAIETSAQGDGAERLARLVQRRVEAGVLAEEEIAAVT